MKLHLKDIEACPAGAQSLGIDDQQRHLKSLSDGWTLLSEPDRLQLKIKTANFAESLENANVIGKMADEQWHHPKLMVAFKEFHVEIYTHDINGLREADFVFAAKVDHLLGLS